MGRGGGWGWMGVDVGGWGVGVDGACSDSFVFACCLSWLQGLCDAVGVSNFNAQRVRDAKARLGAAGVLLASNQVMYSLLYRGPERNGLLEACKENDVTLIAYSPLGLGLLSGEGSVLFVSGISRHQTIVSVDQAIGHR